MESTMTYRYVGLPYAMKHSGNINLRLPEIFACFRGVIYIYEKCMQNQCLHRLNIWSSIIKYKLYHM